MASFKKLASGACQLCIRNKLLPKPLWATFDSVDQAQAYARQLEGLLAQGIVPTALLTRTTPSQEIWLISRCIAEYVRHNAVPLSEIKLLDTIKPSVGRLATGHLNYEWAEGWVRSMKRDANLAPSTIRHRHGALARCFDWMCRKHPELVAQNPLRLLKRGFSSYTDEDRQTLALSGREAKFDTERDRRLDYDEEQRILDILPAGSENRTFFILALETAMRMRECYTLVDNQLSFGKRTIHLERSKNGDNRQVPLSSTAVAIMKAHVETRREEIGAREGRLFSYWSGATGEKALDDTTSDVSREFRLIFDRAGVVDFKFHDLRHEATCRLFEKTSLSEILISKITGHRDPRMLKRYASLRGSDLAIHLW